MLPGILSAGLAFTLWGIFPIYLKLLHDVPPLEILSHRVVWSVVFLSLVLYWRKQWAWVTQVRMNPRIALTFTASAAALGANWVIYIWAINADRVIDASLGYFITPLFNVLFGRLLGERLLPMQWLCVALAACGVGWLTASAGHLPWIGLLLGISFGSYGLLRKTAPLGALEGLAVETLLMLPVACAFLLVPGSGSSHAFAEGSLTLSLLLAAAGPVTAIPLLLFAFGARRIPLSIVGLLQYIGPSIQLLLGIWLYHEPFDHNKLIGFALIWSALALFSAQGLWLAWRHSRPAVPVTD